MESEILKLRGRLAVNEQLSRSLSNGINVDIDDLRSLCDRHADKTELDADRIEIVSDRLAKSIRRLKELAAATKKIEQDLGE